VQKPAASPDTQGEIEPLAASGFPAGDGARDASTDTFGKLIDQKSAQELRQDLDQDWQQHSAGIMALLGQMEKAGKRRSTAAVTRQQRFPAFPIPN
jgi:hypothetical protein